MSTGPQWTYLFVDILERLEHMMSTSLWWTIATADSLGRVSGWSDDKSFPDHTSDDGPALATYNSKLWCVHRGGTGDTNLWYTSYDQFSGWNTDRKVPNQTSPNGPAVAEFNGRLWCVYRGSDSDASMYSTSFDGGTWGNTTRLAKHCTAARPALAVFGNRLWCVHRGRDDDSLWYTTSKDGVNWDTDTVFPHHKSSNGPALAADHIGGRLYCVHTSNSSSNGDLYYTYWDGAQWSTDTKFPTTESKHESAASPALVVSGSTLLCVHRGWEDINLWYTQAATGGSNPPDSLKWGADIRMSDHYSAAGPALAIDYEPDSVIFQTPYCAYRGR